MGGILKPEGTVRAEQYSLSDKDFKFICQFVYDTCGIVLDERKREMIYRRLMRRTRELKIGSFPEYCQLLKVANSEEIPHFINAITTNLTSFFRESHHFDYLREQFLPDLIRSANGDKGRLRIWSSASSTGEEPYSIAITLSEALGTALDQWDVRILATDLDSDVVAYGQQGIYKAERIDDLASDRQKRWFRKGSGDNAEQVKVATDLAAMITFKSLNLLHDWPMKGPFDVIFCRNVLIYFDKPTQEKLIPRFYELLRPGGILFLGHSESISVGNPGFEMLGKTIFKKPI